MAEQDKGVEEPLDRLLEGRRPEELVGARGLLEDLTKRLYERALQRRARRRWLEAPKPTEASAGARVRKPETEFFAGEPAELLDSRYPEGTDRPSPPRAQSSPRRRAPRLAGRVASYQVDV